MNYNSCIMPYKNQYNLLHHLMNHNCGYNTICGYAF